MGTVLLLLALAAAHSASALTTVSVTGQGPSVAARSFRKSLSVPLARASERWSPMHLADCVNSVYAVKKMNWDSALAGSLPALKAVGAWWSSRVSTVPLTVVTQATIERMPQLQAQCRAWKGPLSVVLYQAIYQEHEDTKLNAANAQQLKETLAAVTSFAGALEAESDSCHLSLLLVYELFTDQRAMILYPMNALRNLARLQARTPMVAMLDVDMVPGRDLALSLADSSTEVAKRCLQVTSQRGVVVLPTFETNVTLDVESNKKLVDSLVQQSKADFVSSVAKGRAAPFDFERYPPGHNWTLFERWYTAKETYRIDYGYGFEPFVIIDRKLAPWHDVRYRGYGWNKIVHVSLLNYTGFTFYVHPTAFIIHRAHAHSQASNAFFDSYTIPFHILATPAGKQHDGLKIRLHNEKMFDRGQQEMQAGQYKLSLDAASRNCMLKLPWYGMQPVKKYLRAARLAVK